MQSIKKSKTLLLLGLLFAALLAYGIQSMIYQKSLQKMNQNIETLEDDLSDTNQKLVFLIGNMTKLESEYTLKVRRESELTKQYTNVLDLKENITTEKKGLEVELNSTLIELRSAKTRMITLEIDVQNLEDTVSLINATLKEKEEKLDDMTDDYQDVLDDLDYVCDQLGTNITECQNE